MYIRKVGGGGGFATNRDTPSKLPLSTGRLPKGISPKSGPTWPRTHRIVQSVNSLLNQVVRVVGLEGEGGCLYIEACQLYKFCLSKEINICVRCVLFSSDIYLNSIFLNYIYHSMRHLERSSTICS